MRQVCVQFEGFGFHVMPVLPEAVLTVDGHLLKYTSPCSFAPLHFLTGKVVKFFLIKTQQCHSFCLM